MTAGNTRATATAWSITARLIVLFTVSASLLVLVVVAIMYYAIARHLDEEHEHLVGEIVHVLQQAAPNGSYAAMVTNAGRIATEEPASYSDPYWLRVVDARGAVVAASRGMEIIPLAAFSGMAPSANALRPRRWESPSGDTFLLAVIDAAQPATTPTSIQVALNVTRDRVLMRSLRDRAAMLLLLALAGAAVAGALVVRQSLRPLQQIAGEVSAISAERLEQRLPLEARPRELMGLVRAFNLVLDRLDRAFAGLSQFSSNLAHELRTPLNNLKGEAEVTLLQPRSPEEYREVLASSLEEYDRLSKMVDGLLFLARAESHETKPQWSFVQLEEQAREVVDFYSAVAEEKEVTLQVRGAAACEADAVLVRRAVGNLVSNALRHVGPGGHVAIALQESDEAATIRVMDDGSGIVPADLPKVMERFYRGSEMRGDASGSGLGLAIVKSIAELHGGSVSIESSPHSGTVVTLRIPRQHSR